ncbi:hypothetical protein GEV02_03010 [Rugamonas sp. FT29W]|uniref:Uncharacterized protein n=1 Tax=Rugamonas aquatica TaxID=2743357 RepID=A0A6A7MWE2_9BURK|nr:hypothetical protein [Rugamonas aquatica]
MRPRFGRQALFRSLRRRLRRWRKLRRLPGKRPPLPRRWRRPNLPPRRRHLPLRPLFAPRSLLSPCGLRRGPRRWRTSPPHRRRQCRRRRCSDWRLRKSRPSRRKC